MQKQLECFSEISTFIKNKGKVGKVWKLKKLFQKSATKLQVLGDWCTRQEKLLANPDLQAKIVRDKIETVVKYYPGTHKSYMLPGPNLFRLKHAIIARVTFC